MANPPAGLFFPTLRVNHKTARPLSILEIEVSGLGDAKAAHLLHFDIDCGFAQRLMDFGNRRLTLIKKPGMVPAFSSDSTISYQLRQNQALDIWGFALRSFDAVGVPVGPGGVAKFELYGYVGTYDKTISSAPRFDENAVMAANRAGENPGEGYKPYLYLPETNTIRGKFFSEGCVASSLIMVQGADSVWRMADRSGSWKPVAEVSEPKVYTARLFVPRYRRITIENTWALRDLLDPQIKPAPMMPLQSCTGQSIGPAGTFPVGLQERNGDIAIAVRSGPLGTKCLFQTKAALLPPGVRIVNVT